MRRLTALLLCWAAAPLAAQAPGETFSDCDVCPEMVVLPSGSFEMGTPLGAYEVHEESGEGPPIQVTIRRPFALGKTEVTIGQFQAFVDATGYEVPSGCTVWDKGWIRDAQASWRRPGQPRRPKATHPVSCVNFADALAYAAWLAEVTDRPYRLPSESEWEFAARAGTTWPRPWGANNSFEGVSISLTCEHANVYDVDSQKAFILPWPYARCRDGYADVAPVASFQANAYGVHDMIGNVWEFTADCFTASYWGRPPDERAWVWEGGCERRVIRGGAWISRPANARPARREDAAAETRGNDLGFRVARDLN
jgi:formylglycine-generating enzyme required for sulfatase activity